MTNRTPVKRPRVQMRGTFAKLAASALACSLLLSASPVLAQSPAAEAFERGVGFFRDGDFEAAMVEFKQAYKLDPNWRVLYNLGQTSRELRNYSAALDALERYLAEGGQEIDAERRKRVEGWVKELQGKVGTLELVVDVAGAEVSVDDLLVGTTPLQKGVTVNAGRRKLSVMKAGYAPLTRSIDIAGTEKKRLDLTLVPLSIESKGGARGAGGAPPKDPPPATHEPSPWPWGFFAVTVASGVTTGVLGGLAFSKKSDFEAALVAFPADKQTIDDTRADARSFAIGADVMGGVTIAAAAVTIIGFVVEYGGGGAEESPAAARLELGPGFAGLSGRF